MRNVFKVGFCLIDHKLKIFLENPEKHESVSEFIEMNLLSLLATNPVDITTNLGEAIFIFLTNIAENLEHIEKENFPENALKFACTFDRGISHVMNDCRTSDQHVSFSNLDF